MGSDSKECLDSGMCEHMEGRRNSKRHDPVGSQENIDCKGCKNSHKCIRCADCEKCKKCNDCTACENCEECEECRECVDCKECELCERCKNCEDCKNCVNCRNCTGCRNCKGCKDNGNRKDEQVPDLENTEEVPSDKILFDSLVSNEREYLQKVLKSKMFGDYEISENACVEFFNWLLEQFERIRLVTPSPTLTYNLEFFCKITHTRHLFEHPGDESKREIYLKRIVDQAEENYEADDLDIFSLADASRKYIKQNVIFFDSRTIKELSRIYDSQEDHERKQLFMEMLPYTMNHRNVFKLIRELIMKMDKNTDGISAEEFIPLWSEAIIDHEMPKDKKNEILSDLVGQDFDYVPLRFYDNAQ